MSTLQQAIRMEHPDTIPVTVGMLPAAWMKYGSELQRLVDQYPQFFGGLKMDLEHVEDRLPASYRKGVYIDEWNCVWHNEHAGNESFKSPPAGTAACPTDLCTCACWTCAALRTRWSGSPRRTKRSRP